MPPSIRFDSYLWTVLEDAGHRMSKEARDRLSEDDNAFVQIFVKDQGEFCPCYFDLDLVESIRSDFETLVNTLVRKACANKVFAASTLKSQLEEMLGGIHGWGFNHGHLVSDPSEGGLPLELNLAVLCRARFGNETELKNPEAIKGALTSALNGEYPLGAILESFHAFAKVSYCDNVELQHFLHEVSFTQNLIALANKDKDERADAIEKICERLPSTLTNVRLARAIWAVETIHPWVDEILVAVHFFVKSKATAEDLRPVVADLQSMSKKLLPPLLSAFRALYLCRPGGDEKRIEKDEEAFLIGEWQGIRRVAARLRGYSNTLSKLRSILEGITGEGKSVKSYSPKAALLVVMIENLQEIENGKIVAIPMIQAEDNRRADKSISRGVCTAALKRGCARELIGAEGARRIIETINTSGRNWAPQLRTAFSDLARGLEQILLLKEISVELSANGKKMVVVDDTKATLLGLQKILAIAKSGTIISDDIVLDQIRILDGR